jgi:protein subunit release factor B
MKPIPHLNDDDLEELFSRASGPGGQNVNKVSTRVSLRHRPTGITVHVQESRTQAGNRRIARERLLEAIRDHQKKIAARERAERERTRRRNRPKPAKVKRIQIEGKRRRSQTKQMRRKVDD